MSHDTSPKKLIYVANQIGKVFAPQGHDKAVAGVARHLTRFWDPSMRKKIVHHLDQGGEGSIRSSGKRWRSFGLRWRMKRNFRGRRCARGRAGGPQRGPSACAMPEDEAAVFTLPAPARFGRCSRPDRPALLVGLHGPNTGLAWLRWARRSLKCLGLAVDEVIHHDEVSAAVPVFTELHIVLLFTELHIAARDPNQEHLLARIEPDPEE